MLDAAARRRLCAGRHLGRVSQPGGGAARARPAAACASCRSRPTSPSRSSCRPRFVRARGSASFRARPSAISSRRRRPRFLRHAAGLLGRGAHLIVGVDLIKDVAVLDAAYNDAAGVTAAFNLNLLRRINRELGADFDLDRFRHHAFFNRERSRIEMHLESRAAQKVRLCDRTIAFAPRRDHPHREQLQVHRSTRSRRWRRGAGWSPVAAWTDPKPIFLGARAARCAERAASCAELLRRFCDPRLSLGLAAGKLARAAEASCGGRTPENALNRIQPWGTGRSLACAQPEKEDQDENREF